MIADMGRTRFDASWSRWTKPTSDPLEQRELFEPAALTAAPSISQGDLKHLTDAAALRKRYDRHLDNPLTGTLDPESIVDYLVNEPPCSAPSWFAYAFKTADRTPDAYEQAIFLAMCRHLVRQSGSYATIAVSDYCETLIKEIRKVRRTVMRRKKTERRQDILRLIDTDLIYFVRASLVISWSRRAMGLGV